MFGRQGLLSAIRFWVLSLFVLQRFLLKLNFEFRGLENLPEGPFIIASAHQSAWDTIGFYAVLRDPCIILKKELYWIPLFGVYANRLGMVSADRSGSSAAARSMLRKVKMQTDDGRVVLIFPEGTRSSPGQKVALKSGVRLLYRHCSVPVIPVSLNSGCFWGRRSFLKRPGTIVAEFCNPIAPGLKPSEFEKLLSDHIDAGNRKLYSEAKDS